MSIEFLNPDNPHDVNGVTALHYSLLSDSPVVKMGEMFMRKFYYRQLVQDELIGCIIGRVEQKVVGFISYTRYPLDFMMRGLRKRWLYLSWLIGMSVIAHPAVLGDMAQVFRMMRERRDESASSPCDFVGEVLSLAVLPEFRNFVPVDGTSRLAVRLFDSTVEYFREQKFRSIYLHVQPSNLASNLFCRSMGCEFEKVIQAGLVTHRYTYHLKTQCHGD